MNKIEINQTIYILHKSVTWYLSDICDICILDWMRNGLIWAISKWSKNLLGKIPSTSRPLYSFVTSRRQSWQRFWTKNRESSLKKLCGFWLVLEKLIKMQVAFLLIKDSTKRFNKKSFINLKNWQFSYVLKFDFLATSSQGKNDIQGTFNHAEGNVNFLTNNLLHTFP